MLDVAESRNDRYVLDMTNTLVKDTLGHIIGTNEYENLTSLLERVRAYDEIDPVEIAQGAHQAYDQVLEENTPGQGRHYLESAREIMANNR